MKNKEHMLPYRILKPILGPIFKLYYNPKIIGKENIPKEGPILIVGNHKHLYDQCLAIISTKRPIHYMAKKEYFDGHFAFFFKMVGCIPVNRQIKDNHATEEALKVLENGIYAFVYDFSPENIRQAVYLCDDQKVEYGFALSSDMFLREILDKDRFLISKESVEFIIYDIYDFAGNIVVNDVSYNNGLCVGFQDGKVWVGFEDDAKKCQEVIGMEAFERNRSIHLGYGEYKNIYVESIIARDSIITNFGFAFILGYLYHESDTGYASSGSDGFFIVNGDKLIFCPIGVGRLRNWWDGTILAGGKYVMSQEGEQLAELEKEPSDEDIIISLTEGLRIGYYDNFELVNYEEGITVWSTDIPQLEKANWDARVTTTILEKNASIWKINFKVVNRDGSQFSFDISIDIESGELQ